MEIIETGKLPEKKVYTVRCPSCNTKFKFKQEEGNITFDQRDGNYIAITCPLEGCGKSVTCNL